VLAPTAELAAALFDAVQRHHRDAGATVWPTPRVRDFASWLSDWHTLRQRIDPDLPRLLDELEERELWRRVVLESPWSLELLEPMGAAEAARRARRAMLEHGIPAAALAHYPGAETAALREWIQAFDARCRELEAIPADALLGRLAPPGEKIAWIDSPGWRPVVRHWLGTVAAMGPLPAPGAAPGAPAAQCAATLCYAATPEQELAMIAEWAERRLARDPASRLWIAVPDLRSRRDALIDAFDAVLAPQRFGLAAPERAAAGGAIVYAVAGGTPLADYAPVRSALTVMGLCRGLVSFERFSAALRAPELQADPAAAAAAACLDLKLRTEARSDMQLADWLTLARRLAATLAPSALGALTRLEHLLQHADSGAAVRLPSQWVQHWIALYEAVPWAHADRWGSRDYQAADKFRELLARIACADRSLGLQRRESAEALVASAARDTAFQPETGVAPVWITAQCTDPWLSYAGIWISGLSERRWPAPAEPVPLLPIALQVRHGIETASAASQWALARELQSRWPQRTAELIVSCAGGATSGPVSISPLAQALAPPPPGSSPHASESPPHARGGVRPHWQRQWLAAPVLERVVAETAPPFGRDERTRGVATLRAQSRCPFRGFAETRLEAAVLDRPDPGFNALERGIIVHAALEGLWGELRDWDNLQALAGADQRELLGRWAAEAVATGARRRDPGAVWQRRERERLEALLAEWLDVERRREAFTVEALEVAEPALNLAQLEFRCRIDRVDRLADGTRVLIDYKTGSQQADWRGERPDNPQLPVYALMRPDALAAVAYAEVKAGDASFVHESARRGIFAPGSAAGKLDGTASFDALVAVWRERMTRLAAEFAAGRADVEPNAGACRSCALPGLCRIAAQADD